MTASTKKPLVILFDLDDTLILNPTSRALDSTLTQSGYPPLPPHLHALTTGYHSKLLVSTIHSWAHKHHKDPETPAPTYDHLWETYERIWHERQHEITLRPGAKEVIETVAADPELDIAIVTNTFLARAKRKTGMFPVLKDNFENNYRIVTLDHPYAVANAREVRRKPHPDLYQLALEVVNEERIHAGKEPAKPDDCLVFEDSIIGVKSGLSAGMRVVWNPVEVVRDLCRVLVEGKEKDLDHWEEKAEDEEMEKLKDHINLFGKENPGLHVVDTLEGFDWGRYGMETPTASSVPTQPETV
ncbi:HAD-like protein [Ascobolus immersus RN42]|uniref:HAD-like protein n=1 Tax=Ascobolus immersus RN42 TaxID=1160509 RepID=A0A3N4IJG1_ASCIM|nr:HAD-like protein [Ascobolus immersus RN42]